MSGSLEAGRGVPKLLVPMSSPDVSDAERDAVAAVLRTSCLSFGPRVVEFETALASYHGTRHAVAVASGTAALHLGVIAAGVRTGDLVLTTPFSFVASANVILYESALPVFVDIDPDTLNLDIEQLVAATKDLTGQHSARRRWLPPSMATAGAQEGAGRPTALIPVHVFGQPAELPGIARVAADYDLAVVEDACEAIGAEYQGVRVGSNLSRWVGKPIRHAACFGFYPNKQMTTGEGGMILTDDDCWADLFRSLRNQGRDAFDRWLHHSRVGFNYRMSELSAALGLVQARRLDELIASRERVVRMYNRHLASLHGVTPLTIASSTTRMSWFVYVVRLDEHIERDRLVERLALRGVPSRPYFHPIHLQRPYRDQFGYRPGMFPHAEAAGRQTLALPFSGVMTEEQVEVVCDVLRKEVNFA